MRELQLTHIALVGARMSAFRAYGVEDRNELSLRRLAPDTGGTELENIPEREIPGILTAELPVWIHNIIADPSFPARNELLMSLRRFEGELYDNKGDEVVASVLTAGFRNIELDPLNLPDSMPLRERCAMVMNIRVWQEAYSQLESDLVVILSGHVPALLSWISACRESNEIEAVPVA